MKKTYRWDNLTSPEIAKLAENNAIVLIPTGSTEVPICRLAPTPFWPPGWPSAPLRPCAKRAFPLW